MSAMRWRAYRSPVATAAALFMLAACAAQEPTHNACVVANNSGFMVVGGGGGEVRITVAQNGQPCDMALTIRGGAVGGGTITTPASHGTASVRLLNLETIVSYTPAHDYVGSDRFTVEYGMDFVETVDVDVVPLPAKP
jgi:hypothetical protein